MNVQPAGNAPQRPPPSPWLQKFGRPHGTVIHSGQSNLRHSGLAPMFPQLDPTCHADSLPSDPIPRPPDHELDELFTTERTQIDANLGLTTWEMGTLHEHLVNGWPGGHRSDDPPMPHILEQGYGVDVDEDLWHPVFAKGKWYDFRVPILDRKFLSGSLDGIAPDDVWSVDVPRVWKELRVPLELANRWLRHMAKGRWLNHVVHEDREEWMQATPRPSFVPPPGYSPSPGEANQEQFEPSLGPNGKPWRIPARGKVTDYDSDVTLMEIANRLRSKHIWTFVDDGHHKKDGDDSDELYGRTIREYNRDEEPPQGTPHPERPRPVIVTYIHVSPLRVLLNPASTLSERCHSTWCLAMTILHELMHAINAATHDSWRDMGFEPFYGNEWASELGQSAINSFFGGDVSEAPKIQTPGKPGHKYGLATVDFPAPPGVESLIAINNVPVIHLGQVTQTYPLPTAWVSSTLLQSFYETAAQKYGLAAFQAPKLFASRKVWRGFYFRVHRAQPLPNPSSLVAPSTAADPGLSQPLRDTHNALLARRRVYDRIRPWYPSEYYRWQLTPYANVACRAIIKKFSAAVQRSRRIADSDGAERDGARAVSGIYHYLNDHQMRRGLDEPWPRTMWFYAALTAMMRAVLPGRETTVGRDHPFRVAKNVWFPSQACVQARNNRWEPPATRNVYQGSSRMYYMYERHPGGVNNRIWLLEQARDIVRGQIAVSPVPTPLAYALETEVQRLLQEAAFEVVDNDEWLDWEFELPPYTTDIVTAHEDAQQGMFLVPWQGFPGGWPQPGDQDLELSPRAPQMQAMAARVVLEGYRAPGRRGTRRPTTYFTVSEVGEMMSDDRTGPNWALLRDGQGGYDVFDLSDILTEDPAIDLGTILAWSSLGRVIVSSEIIAAIQADDQRPLGKLLTWRHLQEVHEHDGKDGRDLWCVIGQFIYDITYFPFHSDKEKQALIALTAGEEPQAEVLDALNMPGLFKRLAPYICGFVRQSAPSAPARERIFTRAELKRYIYPEIGMYCEIDGHVYDLGRYLQSHPGGAEILRQYAGTDATEAFRNAHGDWASTLKAHSALRVGRIVEGRNPSDRLDDEEIVLFSEVFLIRELIADYEALYDDLRPFGGTDATQALKEMDALGALRQLLSMKHLVCAKVLVPRRRITDAELQKRNRLPDKSERRKRPRADDTKWRAWISVAEMPGTSMSEGLRRVYDVTIPMMYGGAELEDKLRPWLGKDVEDEELAARLEAHYTGFIIGEIVRPGSAADIGQRHGADAARKAQILGSRHRWGRRGLGSSRRRTGAQDNDDRETARRSNKRSKLRSRW
ncbi:uncharacterized protein B0T15DRAFT_177191 [Chaetomium strumarium]|uniref:Cytochrome b5 heme-binding domain-containing protein n=1 Tax=Chaetomium strumarium TaxID=1170767 RepID=A0AAJ0M376_9PEZI|nr:hypothetical protein B0T15DRAFT_177191 [Chaetomium strumarium]